ncbi:MAG: metallophosphoesterase family protein [Acidobacteria bacterium]|nr:metallophosphoesterase family protein [Acidobacteriota bacterium]MBI3472068.1 metallophosphoesterase family protein [Candidatus Solibacter usitatus]
MRFLIVSDIHANWEALEAVLALTEGQYDQIVCLGDLVGYGPDPNPVVEWARTKVAVQVRGNHDRVAVGLDSVEWFNPVARVAALWTQQELTPENSEFVRQLPKGPLPVLAPDSQESPKVLYQIAHGSPLDEDGYIVSSTDAAFTFPYVESDLTFFGHSHLQGGFTWSQLQARSVGRPRIKEEPVAVQLAPDQAYLINPGSVGQPRDMDPRAAFVLYNVDQRCVYYCRTGYDVEKTQAKIHAAGLPELLADRLALGR